MKSSQTTVELDTHALSSFKYFKTRGFSMLPTRNSYRCVLRGTHTTVVKTERKSVVL